MADGKLVDLAYTKAELKEEKREACMGAPSPYPWGMCLSLEKRELDKLGVKVLPMVGSEVHFMAVAKVTGVNQSAREGEDEESRVALQITMLQITGLQAAAEEKPAATPAKEAAQSTTLLGKYKG